LFKLGAHDIIQSLTFMGGAVDKLDKPKHKELWTQILTDTVPGTIKNVYTKKDAILLLYQISQVDYAIGRNPMFLFNKN